MSHQTGLHAAAVVGPAPCTGNRSGPRRSGHSRSVHLAGTRPARSRRPSRPLTPCACAVRGWACGSPRRSRPSRRSAGPYFYCGPDRRCAGLHQAIETGRRYRITPARRSSARCSATRRWVRPIAASRFSPDDGGWWEVAIEEYGTARPEVHRGEELRSRSRAAAAARFTDYLPGGGSVAHRPQARLRVWLPTCCGRPPSIPRGFLESNTRFSCPSTGWTRCGAGITASMRWRSPPGAPAQALDQFLVPFDHQDPSGALPDSVTHSEVLYNFVKPPIHGWARATPPQAADRSRPEDSRHHLLRNCPPGRASGSMPEGCPGRCWRTTSTATTAAGTTPPSSTTGG